MFGLKYVKLCDILYINIFSTLKGWLLLLFFLIENNEDRLKAEQLYEQYKYLMFSEANNILQDKRLAEDTVQQSFVKIIDNLHKIQEVNCPQTRNFVVIICVNTAKNIYNKRLYLNKQDDITQYLDADTADTENNPLDILIDKDSVKQITKAIESLNPIYRDVLLLRRTYRYSREEIGELLDIPVETVKKRLFRARKMLAKVLEKEGLK